MLIKQKKTGLLLIISLFLLQLSSCDKEGNISIFSIQNDIDLGEQVAAEIAANPDEYPLLDEQEYAEAYDYLDGILVEILQSDAILYKEEFQYRSKLHIIDQDVLNAFCTPGGHIYVYTGLIKYLEHEDHLAGVLGHEIAHADKRHSSDQMQKQYGIQLLLDVILGQENQGVLTDIALNLVALKFSRSDESEADDYSVEYLSSSEHYQCNGAAGFFAKLESENDGVSVPEFLSTHPAPENRIEDINAKADQKGCDKELKSPASYEDFKAMLP